MAAGKLRVPVIVGPTAVGKTAVAVALAEHWPLEVVSADSRQVYRRLDIGTAKPSKRERARVPHHLLDVVDPGHRGSAGRYAREAGHAIGDIHARGRLPVVVGGTGLYIRALAEGLFKEPPLEPARRQALEGWLGALGGVDLVRWATRLDPGYKGGGRQRATRAVEVALLSGKPLSWWQHSARGEALIEPWYVVLTAPRPVLRLPRASQSLPRFTCGPLVRFTYEVRFRVHAKSHLARETAKGPRTTTPPARESTHDEGGKRGDRPITRKPGSLCVDTSA